MVTLTFEGGTLLIDGADEAADFVTTTGAKYDPRVKCHRATAHSYRDVLTKLHKSGVEYEDRAKGYDELELPLQNHREPYPHQNEAVQEWWKQGRKGVVVLPTGAGKTFVAQLMMQRVQRSTLVITPTLDLMSQWYSVLGASFAQPIGLMGGGEHDIQPITVSTYDSAYIHMERVGNRFGLVVFDECHHLPGPTYALAAEACLAPFRVGLTATPERQDGEDRLYPKLIGPIVYRREIKELAGEYLADYETVILSVALSEEEREAYQAERQIYRDFVQQQGIQLGGSRGWSQFIAMTSRSPEGRRAFHAFRMQKEIAQASGAKLRLLEKLLVQHRHDRVLIFTNDNKTVYDISRQFLIPAITHQSKVKERHALLQSFNAGELPFLVTSKVLNEGVDVPAANVGIILSGSGSVREHVQRLGRILRRDQDKQAILYEVIAEGTGEEFTSQRRTQHDAYQ